METRSQLQQTDLGPILNHLALESIDLAESQSQPVWRGKTRFQDLGLLYNSLHRILIQSANRVEAALPTGALSVIDTLIDADLGRTDTDLAHNDGKLTYFKLPERLMQEGLSSGMAMPFNAYTAYWSQRLVTDRIISNSRLASHKFDPSDFVSTLRSRQFQASLLLAAHTGNGFYGDDATKFETGMINPFCTLGLPFEVDYSLTREARFRLRKNLGRSDSDGCPVRRAHYPELGRYALAYVEARGISPEELQAPGKSAIVRCCEYISTCTSRMFELHAVNPKA